MAGMHGGKSLRALVAAHATDDAVQLPTPSLADAKQLLRNRKAAGGRREVHEAMESSDDDEAVSLSDDDDEEEDDEDEEEEGAEEENEEDSDYDARPRKKAAREQATAKKTPPPRPPPNQPTAQTKTTKKTIARKRKASAPPAPPVATTPTTPAAVSPNTPTTLDAAAPAPSLPGDAPPHPSATSSRYAFEPQPPRRQKATLDSVMRDAKMRKRAADSLKGTDTTRALAGIAGSAIAFVRAAEIKEADVVSCRAKAEEQSVKLAGAATLSPDQRDPVQSALMDRRRVDFLRSVDACATLLLQTADLFQQAHTWNAFAKDTGATRNVKWARLCLAALGTRCAAAARLHAFRVAHNAPMFGEPPVKSGTKEEPPLRLVKARKLTASAIAKQADANAEPLQKSEQERAALVLKQLDSVQRACASYALSDATLTKLAAAARNAADDALAPRLRVALERIEAIGATSLGGLRPNATLAALIDDATAAFAAVRGIVGNVGSAPEWSL